jgi:hypothetical protein
MTTMSDLILPERLELVEALGQIQDAVNCLDEMTGQTKHYREQLNQIVQAAHGLSAQIYQRDELLEQASSLITALETSATEFRGQRDAVLDEMSTMLNRLKEGDFFSEKFELGREVYQQAMETHNEAFWQSLPYDMADMLGKPWTQTECDFLFSLLVDDAEIIADGYNLEAEDVSAFRLALFDMVKKLYNKGDEDGD